MPKEKIIAENQSLTTRQNLTRVKEIAEEKALNKIIFVSDPFHMYRVKQIAEDLKLTPFLSPTKESPIAKNKWIEFKYILREMFLVAADRFFDF
ncbi:YdcF family protein [Candidatus Peregrinibacteria bacterium]|nr:YdcF family protein [Candidatus Peregrinibacteria bacterium]